MVTLRLMSQNMWAHTDNAPLWEEKGLDCSAKTRMQANVQIFDTVLPDIVGCQEINKDMQYRLQYALMEKGYRYTLVWGNQTSLLYRADKFELLATEYVLYPYKIEGLEGDFNNGNSKGLNLGVFRHRESGSTFVFATTHLWWKRETVQPGSDAARAWQMKYATEILEQYSRQYGSCPIILVGDMNANYQSPAIGYALGEAGYRHAHDIATDFKHEGRGYNGCSHKAPGVWQEQPFETAIDHILVRHLREDAVKRFDRLCPDYYVYISDHAPVWIDVEL